MFVSLFFVCQIEVLPEIVKAVQGTGVEVYLDSGVRLGTDVLKALALGAQAVFVGRPIIWGLAYKVQNLFSLSDDSKKVCFAVNGFHSKIYSCKRLKLIDCSQIKQTEHFDSLKQFTHIQYNLLITTEHAQLY